MFWSALNRRSLPQSCEPGAILSLHAREASLHARKNPLCGPPNRLRGSLISYIQTRKSSDMFLTSEDLPKGRCLTDLQYTL